MTVVLIVVAVALAGRLLGIWLERHLARQLKTVEAVVLKAHPRLPPPPVAVLRPDAVDREVEARQEKRLLELMN